MESRGFDPANPHVHTMLRMRRMDWLALASLMFCFALFLAFRLGFVTMQSF
jgi:energy-coupling factor transporter transmembrane protein EcfT